MAMSPLSVENIIYLKFALLKTYLAPWVAVFSTSATTDKILGFIKSVSFRPAGRLAGTQEVEQCRSYCREIFIHSAKVRFLPLVEMTHIVFVIPHLTVT